MTDVMKVRVLLTDKWERTARFLWLKKILEKFFALVRFRQIKFPVYSERVKRLTRHSHKVTTVGSTPTFATPNLLETVNQGSQQQFSYEGSPLAKEERLPTFSNNNLKI